MIVGTPSHRLILEPERVGDFAVWGEISEHRTAGGNMRPRNGKDWDAFKAANADKMIVTADQRDEMVGMAVGARKNVPIMKYANAKGQTEVSMVWRDKQNGRLWKGRIDKLLLNHTICDLKTTRDCHRRKFETQSYALGYHIKMSIYWSGYLTLTGHMAHPKLLAIDSKAPYESAVYRVTSDVLLQGADERDELLAMLDKCEETNTWPAELDEETDLMLPTWLGAGEQDSLEEFAEPEVEA